MKSFDEKLKKALLERGLLTEEQYREVSAHIAKSKASFKEYVLRQGLVKEEDMAVVEARIIGMPYLDLSEYLIDEKAINLLPEKIARTYSTLPVFKIGKHLTVATADPLNVVAFDEIRAATGAEVEMVISTKSMIKKAIDQYYGVTDDILTVARYFEQDLAAKSRQAGGAAGTADDVGKMAEEAPVIRLVNLILMRALEDKASDIHVEPEEELVRIRNRVDGILREHITLPVKLHPAIVSRIKILTKLDIAETRKPQDGKFRLKVQNRELDIRVSTFPTMHGENIVMRLLEQSKVVLGLSDLGFDRETQDKFESFIRKAYGMILVSGPTGSGKTTTLYSAIHTINTMDKNIITIEDPVEYQLKLVRQTQVNVKAGLTFASGLRSILRQDPDVILVGEIRDKETADIAIQAALTGHLVFSTIHTNDAAGAIARLTEMEIEPFLISSALIGVLAQRLVRTICSHCKEGYELDLEVLRKLGVRRSTEATTFYRGKGCARCKNTGYDRRVGIFELLSVDETIQKLILAKVSAAQIKEEAQRNGMISMRLNGIRKAQKGLTTLEEVLKVTLGEN